jgi:NAD(P)-dependent dehydrogenase (short-subunit alcohol dehydrogenase family)
MWTKQNMPGLTGKTAIVTGANAGVGYETALALYEAGAHVVLACRSMDNAEAAMASMQRSGGDGRIGYRIIKVACYARVILSY